MDRNDKTGNFPNFVKIYSAIFICKNHIEHFFDEFALLICVLEANFSSYFELIYFL